MTGAARSWARAGGVLAAVLLVDQVTKVLVRSGIDVGEENPVLPAISLVHVKNRGVAFSALEGQAGLVIAVIVVAIALLVAYFATHATRPLIWLPVGLLAGGAAGNIIDRVRDGAVTDFIKLPLWPAFNVADVAITFGVLALLAVFERAPERTSGADGRA